MRWEYLREAPERPPALDHVLAAYALLAYCAILLFDACPGAVTLWSSRALQASAYAGGVGALAVQDSDELSYIRFVAVFALVRLGLVIAHDGDVAITLGLNLVYFVISAVLCPYEGIQALELCGSVLVVAVTIMYGHSRRATLEGRASQKMADLMGDLVSTITDAVVHLSSDLEITLPTPQLQVMLLRSSKNALMGTNFLELLGDGDAEEVEHLERFLMREEGAANLMHTNLKDAYNTTVRVQLFHAHGPGLDGETMHVMAIQENTEMGRTPPPPNLHFAGSESPRVATIVEGKKSHASSSGATVQLEGSDSTVVWIDHRSDGFPIIKCSPGFTALCGPSPGGTKFLEWVQNKEKLLDQFPLASGDDGPSGVQHARLGPVTLELTPPQMPPGVKKVRVDVQVRLVQEGGKDMAMLTFGEIRWKKNQSSSKQVSFSGDDDRSSTVTFIMYADNRWEISALHQQGQFTDIGLEVGRNFLDYLKERKALTHQISGKLLFPAEANLAKFIKTFKPKWIGSFAMRQPGDPTSAWHDISVEVTDFAMSTAGPYLCCTALLRSQELAV